MLAIPHFAHPPFPNNTATDDDDNTNNDSFSREPRGQGWALLPGPFDAPEHPGFRKALTLVILCQAIFDCTMLCHAMLCYAMPCDVIISILYINIHIYIYIYININMIII